MIKTLCVVCGESYALEITLKCWDWLCPWYSKCWPRMALDVTSVRRGKTASQCGRCSHAPLETPWHPSPVFRLPTVLHRTDDDGCTSVTHVTRGRCALKHARVVGAFIISTCRSRRVIACNATKRRPSVFPRSVPRPWTRRLIAGPSWAVTFTFLSCPLKCPGEVFKIQLVELYVIWFVRHRY